jgi:hypothetical protein
MSFGYERQPNVMLNDSAILDGWLYNNAGDTLIPMGDITSAIVTILKPGDDPNTPSVQSNPADIVGDGHAQFQVINLTDIPGEYKGVMTFDYTGVSSAPYPNALKSVIVDFTVIDPFVRSGSAVSDPYVDMAWLKLEDCFDSELGGPWLRDQTLAVFDKTKIRAFIPEVIMNVNETMPFSDYTEASYPWSQGSYGPLAAQGLLVASIRHLMRSYTEQPDVVSSPVAFMDRKRYQQAWKAVYDVEAPLFDKWTKQVKLRGYDITHGSLLLGTKAGRMLPGPMRSRNVGRGF